MKRRVLWVTDPWDELAPHAIDTSLRLMEISHQLGHTTFWSEPRRLEVRGSQISIEARRLVDVKPARRSEDFIFDASLVSMNPMELDTIFCRVDPPVDDRYSHHVQILNYRVTSSARAKPKIINPPGILLGLSGKMLALITGMPTPPSLITSSRRGVREFVVKHGHCVVKPLRGFQGRGVSTVSQSDVPFALDDSGDDFLPLPIIVQKCVHSRDSREIRLWFANGKLMGAGERLSNFIGDEKSHSATGASSISGPNGIGPCSLSEAERITGDKIGQILTDCRIEMSAVDLIDGLVIDVNIVSPGLIVEMEAFDPNLGKRIVSELIV